MPRCARTAPTAAATNAPAAAATATNAPAAATPASTNAPSIEQRLESIEAYFQNGDPTAPYKDTNGNWTVNFALGAVHHQHQPDQQHRATMCRFPGAGHNAWLLTSTALVLFMTLPGLALFYGGLVRKKNVLSVLRAMLPDHRLDDHPVGHLQLRHDLRRRRQRLGRGQPVCGDDQ